MQSESCLIEKQWQSSLNKHNVLRGLAVYWHAPPASVTDTAIEYRSFSISNRRIILAQLYNQDFPSAHVLNLLPADALFFILNKEQKICNDLISQVAAATLLGIKQIAFFVEQNTWADADKLIFEQFLSSIREHTHSLFNGKIIVIPVTLQENREIAPANGDVSWYDGPNINIFLQQIPLEPRSQQTVILGKPANIPVENGVFIFNGTILSGSVSHGSALRLASSGEIAAIAAMNTPDGRTIQEAAGGDSIVLHLDRAVRTETVEILSLAKEPVTMSDQFQTLLFWQGEQAGLAGRSYLLDLAGQQTRMTITALKKALNPCNLTAEPCQSLRQGHIGICNLITDKPVAITPYQSDPALGKIAIYSLESNDLLAFGLIRHSLRRSENIHRQSFAIARHDRECLNGHAGKVIWFTGLSGSGKSALANALEQSLHAQGMHTYLLDGDNVRHGLNNDLGFTESDRIENIRRIAEVAKLMLDAGLIVMTAFISPFRRDREMARKLIGADNFMEIYISTPLEECERRDPKGLYRKARAGQLPNMTGIDSPYEAPADAAVTIDTSVCSCDEGVQTILEFLPAAIALKIH